MNSRSTALKAWVASNLPDDCRSSVDSLELVPLTGDASFRRYFRLGLATQSGKSKTQSSLIVVDAPPETEKNQAFVAVARSWKKLDINVPQVFAVDYDQGFMLLSDLGDTQLLSILNQQNVDQRYGEAIESLVQIQRCKQVDGYAMPDYDRTLLMNEMGLFRDWLVIKLLDIQLTDDELQVVENLFQLLANSALEQPRVCVHRDYHARNLMVVESALPGVIDFQDAVWGPVTYDLVSLLKDCYVQWPRVDRQRWVDQYCELAVEAQLINASQQAEFMSWFELMGMQRHLKAVGIFARLKQRDGKAGYLEDIPRTLSYILELCEVYPQLTDFCRLLKRRIIPAMHESNYFTTDSMGPLL